MQSSTSPAVNIVDFLDAMEKRWLGFHNVPSKALRATWKQIAETFNRKLHEHGTPFAEDWHVLQPPTGSGKTQSTVVYAALLATKCPAQGMMIVTRLIADADTIAHEVNELAGRQVAAARHSDNKLSRESLKDYPVLVVTHAAYVRALKLDKDGFASDWHYFSDYSGESGRRGLIVVDEALDTLILTTLREDEVRQLDGFISAEARQEFPEACAAVSEFKSEFAKLEEAYRREPLPTKVIRTETEASRKSYPDLSPLRDYMRAFRYLGKVSASTDIAANERLAQRMERIFAAMAELQHGFRIYARRGNQHTLSTARTIIPPGKVGCVVLDATAGCNPIYDVMERVTCHAPPERSRSYRNVTVHVSQGHRLGKTYMEEYGKEESARLISVLNETIPSESEVFIACHKHNKPNVAGLETPFRVSLGHWGAIDGSNLWRDCDTAVIFGIPYRNPMDPITSFFALQGTQDSAWIHDPTLRRYRQHADIKTALQIGWIVSQVVQAINRIHCRKAIDHAGNCPPTDVYLLLPSSKTGDKVRDGIVRQMPGVNLRTWDYGGMPKKKARRSRYKEALAAFIDTIEPGAKWAVSKVKARLSIPQATWERLAAELRDSTSLLGASLAESGVVYSVERAGRTQRAYLVKE